MNYRSCRNVIALLVVLTLMISVLFILPKPAQAQTSFTIEQLSGDGHAYIEILSGFEDCGSSVATYNGTFDRIEGQNCGSTRKYDIRIVFDDPVTVTHVEVDFDYNSTQCGGGRIGSVILNSTSQTNLSGAGCGDFTPTMSWTGSVSGVTQFRTNGGIPGGHLYVTRILIQGTFASGTPPSPSSGLAAIYDYCPLLQNEATFDNLPGKWTGNPTPKHPDGETKGLLATNGKYSLSLALSKDKQYILATKFHVTDPTRVETFGIQLGNTAALIIQISNTSSTQTQTIAANNYEPTSTNSGTSFYNLQIFSQLYTMGELSENGDLVIDYICVADNSPNIDGENDPNKIINSEACKECVYSPIGDLFKDIPKIIDWLKCVFVRLFDCVLKNWLYQLNLWLGGMGKFLASWQMWGGEALQRFITWAGDGISNVVQWLGGFLANVLQFLLNGAITFFNWLGLGGVVNWVLDFISKIIPTVQRAAEMAGLIFQIAKYWIERIVELILSIVFAIPLIFQSVIDSFNQSAQTIPVWAPTCNDSNTVLFGPCLGFYVLDNTVFDGPIYYILILLCGFIAFNTLLWSLGKIKGAFATA